MQLDIFASVSRDLQERTALSTLMSVNLNPVKMEAFVKTRSMDIPAHVLLDF